MPRAKLLSIVLAGLVASVVAGVEAGPARADTLVVPIDKSRRLAVNGAASVVVGNPQVADVTVVDSHTVFVSGRGYGETDVVVLDGFGRVLFSGDVLVAGGQAGQVSVYRGAARTDMACAPGCVVALRSETKGGSSGSAGGATPTAAAAGQSGIGGLLGGIMGGVMGAAAAGVSQSMSGGAPQH